MLFSVLLVLGSGVTLLQVLNPGSSFSIKVLKTLGGMLMQSDLCGDRTLVCRGTYVLVFS
jgi:hypothetical protein